MSADASVLRLVDRPQPGGRRTVVVSWQAPGVAPREATTEVSVRVDPGVAEKLRWYLEDYAEFPTHPAPAIAAETEQIVARLGRELFAAVFGAGDAAAIWAQASIGGVDRLRVEVDADPVMCPGCRGSCCVIRVRTVRWSWSRGSSCAPTAKPRSPSGSRR